MRFKIESEGDNFYTVKDVPIFMEHANRGFECDNGWMTGAVQNFEQNKANGYRPPIIVGHNIKGTEKEAYGFLDNLKVKGKMLYADMVRIPKQIKEKIIANNYPSRSVEVLPYSKRILALALLGGTSPHFTLPQMTYSDQEDSQWYRSPSMTKSNLQQYGVGRFNDDSQQYRSSNMNGFNATQKAELSELIGQTLNQYTGKDEGDQYTEQELQVYELGAEEALELLQSKDAPQLFKDEETGTHYVTDEDENLYAIPVATVNALQQTVNEQQYRMDSNPEHYGKLSRLLAKGKGRMKTAGRYVGGKAKAGYGGAKQMGGRVLRHPATPAAGMVAGAAGLTAGVVGGGYHLGKKGGRKAEREGRQGDPFVTPLLLGGVAGGGAYLAGRKAGRKQVREGYQIDPDDGVLYEDGIAVGEFVAYDKKIMPQDPTVNESVDPTDVEEGTDGAVDNELVEGVDRESSDQFPAVQNQLDNQQTVVYNLQQQVDRLSSANALMQEGRRVTSLEQYLLSAKKTGTPVGDIKQTVDYLMTQSDEQINQYKHMLESQPKIALGASTTQTVQQFSLDEARLREDYAANKDVYGAMGVTDKDLQYAGYVRSNGNGTGNGSNNGNNLDVNGESIFRS